MKEVPITQDAEVLTNGNHGFSCDFARKSASTSCVNWDCFCNLLLQILICISPFSGARLLRPKDKVKDQTMFLCQMKQEPLQRTMFPLGDVYKTAVKQIARENGMERIAQRKPVRTRAWTTHSDACIRPCGLCVTTRCRRGGQYIETFGTFPTRLLCNIMSTLSPWTKLLHLSNWDRKSRIFGRTQNDANPLVYPSPTDLYHASSCHHRAPTSASRYLILFAIFISYFCCLQSTGICFVGKKNFHRFIDGVSNFSLFSY